MPGITSSNNLVLVTGASRGIGLAIAEDLLKAQFNVHMIASNELGLRQAQERLHSAERCTYSVVDLMSREEIHNFVNQWSNSLWAIINNAGTWSEERLDEPDRQIWDKMIKLNLEATYFLTKGMHKWIVDGGRIINISSQLGTSGRAGFGAYCATKHGVIGLTRCWALELSDREITVNAVCPGWVRTESNLKDIRQWAFRDGTTVETKTEELAQTLPLGRFIEPEEVAALVGFLVSTEATGITNQAYEIR